MSGPLSGRPAMPETPMNQRDSKRRCCWRNLTGILISLGLLLGLAVGGCAGPQTTAERPPAVELERIALMPVVDMARVYGPNRSVRAPLTGKVFVTGPEASALAMMMTGTIEAFLGEQGFAVIAPMATQAAVDELAASATEPFAERALFLSAVRRLEADAILVGYLYRAQDRQGGRFAVEQPASVAYGLYLLDAAQGRTIWSGEFDETQRSLNENLFHFGTFLKRRGEWITAEQMTAESLKEILNGFGARR